MRTIVLLLALAGMAVAAEQKPAPASATPATHAVQPAFTPLKFGDIRPQGWVLAQMKRDLATGFAGHLDELCREAGSDIFSSGRNQPGKPNRGNQAGNAWWNGETEGNWRCGYLMLACLTQDSVALTKAKAYVEQILASQDEDGYIGIFAPALRYQGNGELWTQNCLFRGLLAYAEATGKERVYTAVKRAVDRTLDGYAQSKKIKLTGHDPVYTDVLEYLHAKTGDEKYLDFGLRLYRDYPNLKQFLSQPETNGKFSLVFCGGHGARVSEMMRMPFWFWIATGNPEYRQIGQRALAALKRQSMPSGALVSQEAVNAPPHPWGVGYEYCAMFEQKFSYLQAGHKTGDAAYFDDTEHLWFNAMQGAREPDGSAILYCSEENRFSVNNQIGGRVRFTPTGKHVAVCCNPNSTRVSSYFISNAWMKPTGTEPALAATLYGPCKVKTQIAGTAVRITEKTHYPYNGEIEMTVQPASPVTFCLWLRNPQWSKNTRVTCAGATVTRSGEFWQVRKQWKAGDTVSIKFDQKIREVPAINGDVALQYGPLLYVLPVKGEMKTVKTYKNSELKDYYVIPPADVKADNLKTLSLPATKRAKSFGFVPKTVAGTNPDYPLDNPATVLEGKLIGMDGKHVPATLVPIGAMSAQLRLVTFPITK